jgi:glycosyltransferase involved in cell wall biosynthesis
VNTPSATPARLQLLTYCPFNDDSIAESLGRADYSYFFVLKRFRPLLERFGPVRPLTELSRLSEACAEARADDLVPVLLFFAPPHLIPRDPPCAVVPVFAWEFDTIPDEHWEDDPRHNWKAVLSRQPAAITHSDFAVRATRLSLGADFRIVSIPAPVFDDFHALPDPKWTGRHRTLTFTGTVLDSHELGMPAGPPFDQPVYQTRPHSLDVSGVAFTTILNPSDGRKNWYDILTAFVWAFRENPDATLIVKLVHFDRDSACWALLQEMRKLAPYQCRIVVIHGYLADAAFAELVRATTFAVNASHAEGQCLPLMEFMSAGKPAIAPHHTALADYIEATNSFLVEGSLEWAAWPQDPRLMLRCTRHRINWESLVRAFTDAWDVATNDPQRYHDMSTSAVVSLERHCSGRVVSARLADLLNTLKSEAVVLETAMNHDRQPEVPSRAATQ